MATRAKARFIEPMLLLRTDRLPGDTERWAYQLKLDGYRAIAFKTAGTVHLRSRNDNELGVRFSGVLRGLAKLPNDTVMDGELVALDAAGRPSFNTLQNYGSAPASVIYYVFDVMVLAGIDVTEKPLAARQDLLERKVLPKLAEPVRYAGDLVGSLSAVEPQVPSSERLHSGGSTCGWQGRGQ